MRLEIHKMKRCGFTLVEIIVVISIVMLLAAILFPAFGSARARSRQAACASNLHQLGVAVALYQQDYDGYFPRGGDAADILTNGWSLVENGQYQPEVDKLPPITWVMYSYIKERQVWHCPADSGYDESDISHIPLNGRPTAYDAFGISYFYHTALTLKQKKDLVGYDLNPPYAEHGASDIVVLFDSSGSWHGGEEDLRRYNALMGDGHVKNYIRHDFKQLWKLKLDRPAAP